MPHDRMRLRAALGLAIAALAAAPALAQDQSDSLAQAQAARAAGDNARAIDLLEQARARQPQDPTILRLLGSCYAAAHRYDEAIATLSRARALAPADQDVALALARAYLWSGDLSSAQATTEAIAQADPANPELPALRQAIERARHAGQPAHRFVVASLAQSVSGVKTAGGHRTWYESLAALAVPVGAGGTISGQVDRESRSGPVDTRLELRFDQRIGSASSVWLAAATTPHADFRERWSVSGGGEAAVSANLALTLDLRYADYATTSVVVATPGIRIHTRDERFSLAARQISLWADNDSYRSGWTLRGEAQVMPRLRLIAGGATYPDTEAGVTRQVRSGFAGVMAELGDRVTLRATYEHENRAQSYTRDSAILAASLRF